jgi:hypothetical protein
LDYVLNKKYDTYENLSKNLKTVINYGHNGSAYNASSYKIDTDYNNYSFCANDKKEYNYAPFISNEKLDKYKEAEKSRKVKESKFIADPNFLHLKNHSKSNPKPYDDFKIEGPSSFIGGINYHFNEFEEFNKTAVSEPNDWLKPK